MASLSFPDQLGNIISLPEFPKRIISLVPSQTELLADLGLHEKVVGITRYCVHPTRWQSEKTIVGGTKKVDISVVRSLAPDLIIGNKEENEKSDIEQLQQEFPVWMSDIHNLDEALSMIKSLGEITNTHTVASHICSSISKEFQTLSKATGKSVLYLIWRNPWMAAGRHTFIDDMLSRSGLTNVLGEGRYPMLTKEDLTSLSPDYVFLSTEPYPFREKHISEVQPFFHGASIRIVDGEMFSWYGSRLVQAPAYFKTLALV